jgi:hypothetical protein
LQDSILKIPNTKRADGVAQDEDPEFKPQTEKKKKKKFQEVHLPMFSEFSW